MLFRSCRRLLREEGVGEVLIHSIRSSVPHSRLMSGTERVTGGGGREEEEGVFSFYIALIICGIGVCGVRGIG